MSDKDGGLLIPVTLATNVTATVVATSVYRRMMPPPRPLTRMERLRARYYGARWRIEGAVAFLLGRHDCGDDR